MIGLIDRERIDEALYGDFETVKAREVCPLSFQQWTYWWLDVCIDHRQEVASYTH